MKLCPEVSRIIAYEIISDRIGHQRLWAHWSPKMLIDEHEKKVKSARILVERLKEEDSVLDSVASEEKT